MGRDQPSLRRSPAAELKSSNFPFDGWKGRVTPWLALGVLLLVSQPLAAQWSTPSPTPVTGGDFSTPPDEISASHSFPDLLKYPKLGDDQEEPKPSPSPSSNELNPDSALGDMSELAPTLPVGSPTPRPTPVPGSAGSAQEQIATEPWPAGISNVGNSFPQFQNQNLALSGAPQVVGLRGGAGRIRVGPFHVGIGISGSEAYNSNIFGAASNPQGDIVSTLSPEIFVQAGTRGTFQLYYRPSYERYLKYTTQNTTNESFAMRVQYPFTRLKLESDLSYIRQSGLFATSTGTAQQALYAFRLGATYKVSSKTEIVGRYETLYQAGDAATQQTENDVILEIENNPTAKMRWAGGMKVGYVTAQGQLQTYAQPYLRASIRPDPHWEVSGQAGVEVRKFSEEVNPQHELISPVASFALRYSPYRNSSYELSVYQTIFNDSFQSNIVNTQTGIRGALFFNLFNRVQVQGYVDVYHSSAQTAVGAAAGDFDFLAGSLTVTYVFHDGVELRFFDNVQQRFMGTVGNDYFSNVSGISVSVNF